MDTAFDKRRHVIACRRLPDRVDAERLQREVSALPQELWGNVRAPVHRETQSLFLKGHAPALGIPGDPEQPVLASCPYIRELLYGLLTGEPGKCLLAALRPRGIVYPHMDAANDYFTRSFRVHVPVFTNPQVRLYCNGRFFRMAAGEAWALNNLAPHAVVNDHPSETRVHLIFDVFPDEHAVAKVEAAPEAPGEDDAELFARLSGRRPAEAQVMD
ncbi:MAG: aspartyl/asparaginyl beta-hydroxylase domain-containing protein [Bacillota bacterium]